MKSKIVLILMGLAIASFGVASADELDDATAHVRVEVDPNIAVVPLVASVDLLTVQTGVFDGDITFRVDANTQKVSFYAYVSDLYKGDDCSAPDVRPIPVYVPPGVPIVAENANPTGGHAPVMVYDGTTVQTPCFDSRTTEIVTFDASTVGHFSQEVTLTPSWSQEDNEKSMGEYSGFVALWAMTVIDGCCP